MADEKAAERRSEPGDASGDPVFASRMAVEKMVRSLLKYGRTFKLSDETTHRHLDRLQRSSEVPSRLQMAG